MIKKFLTSMIFVFFIFLINNSYAYSLKIIVDGQSVTLEKNVNEVVTLNILRSDCQGWEVKTGNVTVKDNTFIMPAADVEIEAIIKTEFRLETRVVGDDGLDIMIDSNQDAGTEVTVTASKVDETSAREWLMEGRLLYSISGNKISFIMPYNDVKLIVT